jgi:ribosomal protein L32
LWRLTIHYPIYSKQKPKSIHLVSLPPFSPSFVITFWLTPFALIFTFTDNQEEKADSSSATMIWNLIQQYTPRLIRQRLGVVSSQYAARWNPPTQPAALNLEPAGVPTSSSITGGSSSSTAWQDALWFAVPKSKVTRSRKRQKTTVQKRLALKKNIVFDPQTGEVTLQHKLPFNWREYLPKMD